MSPPSTTPTIWPRPLPFFFAAAGRSPAIAKAAPATPVAATAVLRGIEAGSSDQGSAASATGSTCSLSANGDAPPIRPALKDMSSECDSLTGSPKSAGLSKSSPDARASAAIASPSASSSPISRAMSLSSKPSSAAALSSKSSSPDASTGLAIEMMPERPVPIRTSEPVASTSGGGNTTRGMSSAAPSRCPSSSDPAKSKAGPSESDGSS